VKLEKHVGEGSTGLSYLTPIGLAITLLYYIRFLVSTLKFHKFQGIVVTTNHDSN